MILEFDKAGLYRKIRGILAKHGADLGALNVIVSKASVRIQGSLYRQPGIQAEFTPELIDAMLREIRAVPGAPRLEVQFDNWAPAGPGGMWKRTKPDLR